MRSEDIKLLPMKQLSETLQLNQVLFWVYSDIIPSLSFYSEQQSADSTFFKRFVLGICTDLCARAIQSEARTSQPFDAIKAAEVSVKVLEIMKESSEADSLLVEAQLKRSRDLLEAFNLQGYVWNRWSDRVSHAEVNDLGVVGLISRR
jgi:hypothetical protein